MPNFDRSRFGYFVINVVQEDCRFEYNQAKANKAGKTILE
jgi:hypothetical protein